MIAVFIQNASTARVAVKVRLAAPARGAKRGRADGGKEKAGAANRSGFPKVVPASGSRR